MPGFFWGEIAGAARLSKRGVVQLCRQKAIIDLILAISFVILALVYILSTRVDQNVVSVDLTNSKLACSKSNKRDKVSGLYLIDNKEYYSQWTYDSCEEFINRMQGQVISGKHVKSEHLLIELRVGDILYTDNSIGMRVLNAILLGLALYAVLRSPLHWMLSRFI